jgi:hypothetical protein
MILLQAMMGFPIVAIGIFCITFACLFIFLFTILSIHRAMQPKPLLRRASESELYWVLAVSFIASCLAVVIFLCKMMNFEGPWIN